MAEACEHQKAWVPTDCAMLADWAGGLLPWRSPMYTSVVRDNVACLVYMAYLLYLTMLGRQFASSGRSRQRPDTPLRTSLRRQTISPTSASWEVSFNRKLPQW
eukprot:4344918-Amphidinium_carterae.1